MQLARPKYEITRNRLLYCAEQGWSIRYNSIHPAAILTPMWEPMLGEGADREERIQTIVKDTLSGASNYPRLAYGGIQFTLSDLSCTRV